MGEGCTGGRQSPDRDAHGVQTQAPELDGNLTSKYLTSNTLRNKDPVLYHRSMTSPQTEDLPVLSLTRTLQNPQHHHHQPGQVACALLFLPSASLDLQLLRASQSIKFSPQRLLAPLSGLQKGLRGSDFKGEERPGSPNQTPPRNLTSTLAKVDPTRIEQRAERSLYTLCLSRVFR